MAEFTAHAIGAEQCFVPHSAVRADPNSELLNQLLAALMGCCNNALKTGLGLSMKQRCVDF